MKSSGVVCDNFVVAGGVEIFAEPWTIEFWMCDLAQLNAGLK